PSRSPSPEHEVEQQSQSSEEEVEEHEDGEEREDSEGDEEVGEDEEQEHGEDEEVQGQAQGPRRRGSSTLPKRPIPLDRRPIARPVPPRSWTPPVEGSHKRKVNGILGILCRQHYPGLVQLPEGLEVADTFDHYAAVNDVEDRDGRKFNNKMERVMNEMLDFYRIEEGYEDLAWQVARTACHKLVKDMMYEAHNQAIIDLKTAMDVQVNRKEAITIFPTKEEYLAATLWWMAVHSDCWEVLVDKWCAENWAATHEACRQRRLLMQGPSHHQGSLSLNEYAAKYSEAHGGQPINTFEAFALSHKGKASAAIHCNPEDPPEPYSNPTAYSRLSSYSEVAKEVYRQDYDSRSHDLDGEVVMRAGKGKKHGRYYLRDSVIDTASTPTLSQIRARTVSGGPSIRERPTATQALQA
ncbi:hypothetical protein EJB05_00239, partial [Eragrostis curvula]